MGDYNTLKIHFEAKHPKVRSSPVFAGERADEEGSRTSFPPTRRSHRRRGVVELCVGCHGGL